MKLEFRPGTFNLRRNSAGRSPCVHVSQILREIALKIGVLKAEEKDEDLECIILGNSGIEGEEGRLCRMALGMAWEDWVLPDVPGLVHQPGEMVVDGIALTPDGIAWNKQGVVVHEVKVTWKSMNRGIEREWLWWTQLKAYCHAAGTVYGVMHVFWVMGDYRGSGPRYMVYEAEFDKGELEGTWEVIKKHAGLVV